MININANTKFVSNISIKHFETSTFIFFCLSQFTKMLDTLFFLLHIMKIGIVKSGI